MKTINTSYKQHHKLLQIMLSALLALTMLTGCNSKPTDDVLYADANTLLASGDFAKALTTFKEISDPTYEDTQSYIHYLNGVTAYEAGNYESAMQSFSMVPEFLNSPDYLHYMNGLKLFENDLLEEALVEFSLVKNLGFEKVMDYSNYITALSYLETVPAKAIELFDTISDPDFYDLSDYRYMAEAIQYYNDGMYYTARTYFENIYEFDNCIEWAAKCIRTAPKSKVIYRNSKYKSSAMKIKFKAPKNDASYYFLKIYNKSDVLVGSVFLRAGGSATISLKAGTYKVKEASGEVWFGKKEAFGSDGDYSVMLFNGDNEYYKFKKNYIYTIKLKVSSGGNVGNYWTDYGDF